METHSFVTSWGDVLVMFCLLVLADKGPTSLALLDGERKKVQLLSAVLRLSSKSTYTSWTRY